MFEWTKDLMGHWGETTGERKYALPTGTFVNKVSKAKKNARRRNRK